VRVRRDFHRRTATPRASVKAGGGEGRRRERTVSLVLRHGVLMRVELATVEELEARRDDLEEVLEHAVGAKV
jgi:hypothetical protein